MSKSRSPLAGAPDDRPPLLTGGQRRRRPFPFVLFALGLSVLGLGAAIGVLGSLSQGGGAGHPISPARQDPLAGAAARSRQTQTNLAGEGGGATSRFAV